MLTELMTELQDSKTLYSPPLFLLPRKNVFALISDDSVTCLEKRQETLKSDRICEEIMLVRRRGEGEVSATCWRE